jgi:hypothetical protein
LSQNGPAGPSLEVIDDDDDDDIKETGCKDVNYINLAQDMVQCTLL